MAKISIRKLIIIDTTGAPAAGVRYNGRAWRLSFTGRGTLKRIHVAFHGPPYRRHERSGVMNVGG